MFAVAQVLLLKKQKQKKRIRDYIKQQILYLNEIPEVLLLKAFNNETEFRNYV